MSLSIMLQGTASDVGKSMLVAGLCRIFYQDGYCVAPFKSQNMSLNSGITADGKEMGRAQIFQAEAAGILPDVRMNPVLLKPSSDKQAQVIVMGKVASDMDAVGYHQHKPKLKKQVYDVYQSLAAEHDIIVLEGAGSPAEINLREGDIVNMGMAEMIDAPVLLVADIDKGGVFASIYGTLALLADDERARVKGVIINKFRGDIALLRPGIDMIEEMTNVPVIGVMPWINVELEDEDGVVLQGHKKHDIAEGELDIAILHLPHISNFTDFNALSVQQDARIRYVMHGDAIGSPDLLIIPGSKNTLGDLAYLRARGFDSQIQHAHRCNIPIIGICGGYQMLGNRLYDGIESGIEQCDGLGLLDCETHFESGKITTQVTGRTSAHASGIFSACTALPLAGYEIHMGRTILGADARAWTELDSRNGEQIHAIEGAINLQGNVAGSYIHGLFDSLPFTRTLLDALREHKGLSPLERPEIAYQVYKQGEFDKLAQAMRDSVDIDRIYHIMQVGAKAE